MARITYEAKQDNVGALIPLHQKRRCVVVRYRDGKFTWIAGRFTRMADAERRAAILNGELAALPYAEAV